jgi:hypothetical protein
MEAAQAVARGAQGLHPVHGLHGLQRLWRRCVLVPQSLASLFLLPLSQRRHVVYWHYKVFPLVQRLPDLLLLPARGPKPPCLAVKRPERKLYRVGPNYGPTLGI